MTGVGEVVLTGHLTDQCVTVLLYLVIAIVPLLNANHIRPDVLIMTLIVLTTIITGVLPDAKP